MMKKVIIFTLIFSLNFCYPIFAHKPYTLEKIIITKKDLSSDSIKNNYATEILREEDIKEKRLNSIVDLLEYVSGVDLRYRGGFGIQGDLSLRGSTYEQVALLIDGIKVIDPQTGHHNLNIPLTIFDIERIEVVKEGISSLYGAGALAGSINIVTKRPDKKALNVETIFGQHALFGQTVSFSLPAENVSVRASFDHKVSQGARVNTDFEYNTATFIKSFDWDNNSWDTLFGYQKKDFGAGYFYSPRMPDSEEHIEAIFLRSSLDFGSLKNNLFLRRHQDKFIWTRGKKPAWRGRYNYHKTYIYGGNLQFDLPVKYGDFLFGTEIVREEINSTNLGKHSRLNEAFSLGFIPQLKNNLTLDCRIRFDHYQKWDGQESFNVALGYKIDERLSFKSSLSHSFRIPSFTELYYSDPGNIGNPNLEVEKSNNFRVGLDFKEKFLDLILEGFLRKGRNLIDWTSTEPDPTKRIWQATNLGRVDFRGIDFIFRLKPKNKYLEKLSFSYTYMEKDKKATGFFSKYALDILKHQFILSLKQQFLGLNLDWQLSYNERYYGETYFVGNLYISKKIRKGFILEPFIKIDNFTDTQYSEIAGVLQPGRWIKIGTRFEW